MEALTSMKTFTPFEFSAFLHMVKAMEFVCEYLGGEDCYSALSWKHAREHAEMHEFLYVDKSAENPMFYASLCDDYHRRHQTFIHSLEFKEVDRMAVDHMNFEELTDRIDRFEYNVHRPTFIPRKRPQDREQDDRKKKRHKPNDPKGGKYSDSVNNPNLADEMKVPEGVKFGDIFNRKNKEGIEKTEHKGAIKHPDGSVKCNNWHHRGWCLKTCHFSDSHEKTLSDEEKADGKKYVESLLENYKKNGKNE